MPFIQSFSYCKLNYAIIDIQQLKFNILKWQVQLKNQILHLNTIESMKSQQQILQQILSTSIKRLKTKLNGQKLQQFETQLDKLPKKIKELDGSPYLFIFKMLGQFRDCADFTLHQYKRLIQEKFISANNPQIEKCLCQLMLNNLNQQQFMITQLLMSITEPSLNYLSIFFNVHTTIPLPENVLINFRATGVSWLAKTFHLQKGRSMPHMIQLIATKVFGEDFKNILFPTVQQTEQELKDYVKKIVNGITFKISQSLQQNNAVSGKFGYCFMCLQPAQYYCKDTKIPVCGITCKKQHLKQINKNHYLCQQYPETFRQQIEEMLLANIQNKNSIALSADYLCMIYMFSDYKPKHRLPHRALMYSALIEQRIWLLQASYHWKKEECFEHILGYGMRHSKQYIRNISENYFMMILGNGLDSIYQIYWNYDFRGPYRLIPVIMSCLNVKQQKYRFVVSLVEKVFNSNECNKSNTDQQLVFHEKDESNMIKLFNQDASTFYQWYKDKYSKMEQDYQLRIAKFIVRNQSLLHKDGLCQILARAQTNKPAQSEAYKESQDFCRVFIKFITQPLLYAPIDQVIRQIFYYVNVNISDRIYKLLEILFEVYHPPPILPGFNQQRLFQFTYYLLMLHTDLHNPNVTHKKPQFQDMLNRVKSFDEELYKNRQPFLKQIYQRMAEQPFSQQKKSIYSIYRTVKNTAQSEQFAQFNPKIIIYDNQETFYENLQWKAKTFSQAETEQTIRVLFKSCFNLSKKPSICQKFFSLLNSLQGRIKSKQHSLQLAQAITNIVQKQPNAVHSWKNILNLSMSFPNVFQMQKIILLSTNLADSQLISFIKQMIIAFPLASCPENYINFLHLNKQRIRIFNQHFLKLFMMEQNLYVQLLVLQSCSFLSNIYFQNLNIEPKIQNSQSAEHLKIVFQSNQKLFIDTLYCIANQSDYSLNESKWMTIHKKSNNFTDLFVKIALAKLFKRAYSMDPMLCPFYQQYLITQTILTKSPLFIQQVDQQMNKKLAQFQSFINELSMEVRRLFVIEDNVAIILDHFEYFFNIHELYGLLRIKMQQKSQIGKQVLVRILNQVSCLTNQQKQIVYYQQQQFTKLIINLSFYQGWNQQQLTKCFEVFEDLIFLKFNQLYQQKFEAAEIFQFANLGFFLLETIQYFGALQKKLLSQQLKIKMLPKVTNIFVALRNKVKKINQDRQMRLNLMKMYKLDRIPGFFKQQKVITVVLLQLSVYGCQQLFISQILESVLIYQYDMFSSLMIVKRKLHQNKQFQELLKKQNEKEIMQWRGPLKSMVDVILSRKIPLKQKNKVLQKLLNLNQSGYLQWNGQKLSSDQNQFSKKMRQFAFYLLAN